jgi:hypothetical protein
MELKTDCIKSTHGLNSAGYAQISVHGKTEYHHRLTYALANGLTMQEIVGAVIMHKCDNPACVNPEHLVLGTQQDNVRDRCAKGRTNTGTTRGDQHHKNVIATSDVNDIRVSTLSSRQLATVYGASQGAIMGIRSFRNWAHIPFQAVSQQSLAAIVARQKEKLNKP